MLVIGTTVQVVKLEANGKPRTRYAGTVIASPPGWVAVRAIWPHGPMDLGYMEFRNGDYLDEYFALEQPFNLMALFRENGTFVAWYCNITYPTRIVDGEVHWQDLYVDVVVYPDGSTLVRDEDELEESGLERSDPDLYLMILDARDTLLEMAASRAYPFSEVT